MTTCQKCHGIHTLITPKFCQECGEQLLELPQDNPNGKFVQVIHQGFVPGCEPDAKQNDGWDFLDEINHYRTDVNPSNEALAASPEVLAVMEAKVADLYPMRRNEPAATVEKRYGLPPGYLNAGTDCGKSTTVNTADPVQDWLSAAHPAGSSSESFTQAQMVVAIGQWLEFGERMLAMNQQGGYFSGSGWAARALAAARDFIEKSGAE